MAFKDFFKGFYYGLTKNISKKEAVSVDFIATSLVEDLKPVKSMMAGLHEIEGLHEITASNIKQVHQELSMAYLFALTYSIELALGGHDKTEEILDKVHAIAYSCLEAEQDNFDGLSYEKTLGERYMEFRDVMQNATASNVCFLLGKVISRHIWPEDFEDKVGFTAATGIWLVSVMNATKKSLGELRKYL